MANFTDNPKLSDRFASAVQFVFNAHFLQVRKQNAIPYISHLMTVASLVLEANGSEDEAIAALCHDVLEDTKVPPELLIKLFGHQVYEMVLALSENKNVPKEKRKQAYVQEISRTDFPFFQSVRLISAADKLHNLRDYATTGRSLWKPEHAAFYAQLMPIYELEQRILQHWINEMKSLLKMLEN
ncbi:HD domain-containing protein [Kamptonema cortianum]|nr:HD domain-containing protein [Desertifilum sp.]MDK3159831.1 HD domain-containing protein [Kamptonema cortianum]